jgi:regulator of protease activity HflC (stomatin/prohibitin superfamily)
MKKSRILLLLSFLAMFAISCTRIESGHVGVKVHLLGGDKGVDNQVVGVGRYWVGMNEELHVFPTYQVNYTYTEDTTEGSPKNEEFSFQTKEGMVCEADLGVAMHFNPEKIAQMFQTYHKGEEEIRGVVVKNAIRDALVGVTGQLPIEYVYGEGKSHIIDTVFKMVKAKLQPTGIEIDNMSLIGAIRIPQTVRNALNAKVEATQLAMKAENDVRKAEADAKIAAANAQGKAQAILIEAKAQADANRMLAASISPVLVQYKAVETWDGKLPQVNGGNTPFINIPNAK